MAAVRGQRVTAGALAATWFALLALLLEPAAAGFAKGIARPDSPPMGWRSWNFFQCNINQRIMEAHWAPIPTLTQTVGTASRLMGAFRR